ncbi:MAG: ABC transporter substrate-binding protein [Flavobacteriales bacterium]
MKHSKTIRVGGVPEHFNLPWQLAAERDVFSAHGINLSWTMYAGGTGAMTKALNDGLLDVAILLTEGFIAAASDGLRAKIGKIYIDTPLVWGIYADAQSNLEKITSHQNRRIAISRYGSGSHLMPMIHASERDEQLTENQFEVVNSLYGGVQALTTSNAELFYWEKFMTRPHVRSGEVKLVGEFSAPWSSFLIVVSEEAIEGKKDAILKLLELMNVECISFKQDNHSAIHLSKRFDMTLPEARKWLQTTQWNYDFNIEEESLRLAKVALASVGKCNDTLRLDSLCASWINML